MCFTAQTIRSLSHQPDPSGNVLAAAVGEVPLHGDPRVGAELRDGSRAEVGGGGGVRVADGDKERREEDPRPEHNERKALLTRLSGQEEVVRQGR